jgi:hypothetical protein
MDIIIPISIKTVCYKVDKIHLFAHSLDYYQIQSKIFELTKKEVTEKSGILYVRSLSLVVVYLMFRRL